MNETTVTRSRPIDGGDSLVLWDPPQDDGVAGYTIGTLICNNPECQCARMALELRRLRKLEEGRFEPFGPEFNAGVSSDGTDLKFADGATSALPGAVVDWIRQQLEGEYHRARLRERWRRCRGQIGDPAYPPAVLPQTIDGMVFFDDVFPYDFDLTVVHDRRLYLAVDQYCLEPNCTCDEIAVQFIDAAIDGEPVGHVRVSVHNLHAPAIQGPVLVGELWQQLVDEIDPVRLRNRFQRMRRVAERRAVVRKPVEHNGPKPGRNDPCPCGSGKKHKRCCGIA